MSRHKTRKAKKQAVAVAVFRGGLVEGEVVAKQKTASILELKAVFTKLPPGKHGFHIHTSGDLRGEGCKGACAHFHKGPPSSHGGLPGQTRNRHTGDLGNIELPESGTFEKTYRLKGLKVSELWGRSMIVHADEDDLGYGPHEDSHTTGHSGARIGCAVFGRGIECS